MIWLAKALFSLLSSTESEEYCEAFGEVVTMTDEVSSLNEDDGCL